jgi:hypothetical protein
MDITNTTGQDTRYNVSGGGGSPIDPHHHREFRMEDTVSWPVLHAGSRVSYNPRPEAEGPWTVFFFVQGKALTATAASPTDHLTLMQAGGGFTVQVN